MKPSPNIGLTEIENPIELRRKINSFKHHIQHLQQMNSKKNRYTSTHHSTFDSPTRCHPHHHNDSSHCTQTTQSTLLNKYERQNLNRITKQNVLLLSKLMKADQSHSNYNDKAFYSTFNQFRNNFLVSKFQERKRSLSEINKENNNLNKKLLRYSSSSSSSQKLSACNQWKKGWSKSIKNYSQNISRKFPKIFHDYRALAQKQLKNGYKTFNRLKLRL